MAKILPILINPNPILRKKSVEVKKADFKNKKLRQLIDDMIATMLAKDGAGLAAPQIGQNIRLLVIRFEDHILVLINPVISKKSWAKESDQEGCLSVVDKNGQILYAPVNRHQRVNCAFIDQNGKKQKLVATGLLARIIQHETDHLDGVLFIDYLKDKKLLHVLEEISAPAVIDLSKSKKSRLKK